MKCAICKHGDLAPGKVTVTLEQNDTVVIIKQVPAEICNECGEYYLGEVETGHVLKAAEEAAQKNAEVEILRYAA